MAHAHSLTEAARYELLSDTRRHHLLALLTEKEKADIDTLARQIAARENDERPEMISDDVHQRVAVSLVHKHVPLLAAHNVVQYDSDRNTVVLMDVVDELEPSIQSSDTNSVLRKLISGY